VVDEHGRQLRDREDEDEVEEELQRRYADRSRRPRRTRSHPFLGAPEHRRIIRYRARYAGWVTTQAERAAERRLAKLEEVQRQLKDGSLKIRQMTAKERRANPPQPRKKSGRRG
jgi:hypothetical protein